MSQNAPTFSQELSTVLNRHSKENGSNTPDFMLAQFLENCLESWDKVISNREAWYGRPRPGTEHSFIKDDSVQNEVTLSRVKARLQEVIDHHAAMVNEKEDDDFSVPMVNAKQLLDLCDPKGMWSHSSSSSGLYKDSAGSKSFQQHFVKQITTEIMTENRSGITDDEKYADG